MLCSTQILIDKRQHDIHELGAQVGRPQDWV